MTEALGLLAFCGGIIGLVLLAILIANILEGIRVAKDYKMPKIKPITHDDVDAIRFGACRHRWVEWLIDWENTGYRQTTTTTVQRCALCGHTRALVKVTSSCSAGVCYLLIDDWHGRTERRGTSQKEYEAWENEAIIRYNHKG